MWERDRERGDDLPAATPFDDKAIQSQPDTLSEVGGTLPPTLRLANLAALRHPYAVDLYLEKTAAHARVIIVRLLGGMDYWRYGVDELSMLARARGIALAFIPGDDRPDARLTEASTVPPDDLGRLEALFAEGGPDNIRKVYRWIDRRLAGDATAQPQGDLTATSQPACGRLARPKRDIGAAATPRYRALVVFYRSLLNAGDIAPIHALCDGLEARGFEVVPLSVTSLKDRTIATDLSREIRDFAPDVILTTTAFSARLDAGGTLLDAAGVPVIQVPMAATFAAARAGNRRGLTATDLAMNIVLPEVDGRISAPAISFKAEDRRSQALEFTRVVHAPDASGIAAASELAWRWARLGAKPRAERTVALVLSNYPAKGGRTAYAVGLDGPASIVTIADDLRLSGYAVPALPPPAQLIAALEDKSARICVDLADYLDLFSSLPGALRQAIIEAWSDPAGDPDFCNGAFHLPALIAGRLIVAVQPDRGRFDSRAADHHDANLPPRHAYVAFYLWLRERAGIDAMIHLGAHGTLEWLPGNSVALSETCAPLALTRGVPVVYPFIVNNPGEAAQAKRRISAVCLGHLTPPLQRAGTHGDLTELEALVDEFSAAQSLDPRRAKLLADAILDKADVLGIAEEAGLSADLDRPEKLARLDAWICDVKDMRIADGLHVYGRPPEKARISAHLAALGSDDASLGEALATSAASERSGLIAALDGRFVPPGPAGAPGPQRRDVLPTGRNLYALDPRAIPTRTAWEIGSRTAEDVVARYVQDHGDWPRSIVLDAWASASMRTGGDDLAQALALLGVRPVWDAATARVSGYEILAPARLGRPRIDVTLRISGLFRDIFESQINLFNSAVAAVAALDEPEDVNPLAGHAPGPRVFGAAPGSFGSGVNAAFDSGETDRDRLGERYLAASSHAYGAEADAPALEEFSNRIKGASAFVHVQDLDGQDLLSGDAFVGHEGGFAAAAAALGARPTLYHVDATSPERTRVRTLTEEVSRVVRARAANPRWIHGQMRHGHRGAAEICETVANLCAFSATSDAVGTRQFDLLFDATFGDDQVRDFLLSANREAARAAIAHLNRALTDGRWQSRRNSVLGRLAETEERLA
ncbi:cobaltochelatase subunit CobN [Oryzibacter oryziterrae]|uniref:cobaltochelatase subunit CobN n=1 Tax=Oryzibacter oryziterrae TaxID=2766474 RepID=UPI001F48FC37|nr:cobaltochelatase subunit CobN [Oryzibacter oryziterrae]